MKGGTDERPGAWVRALEDWAGVKPAVSTGNGKQIHRAVLKKANGRDLRQRHHGQMQVRSRARQLLNR